MHEKESYTNKLSPGQTENIKHNVNSNTVQMYVNIHRAPVSPVQIVAWRRFWQRVMAEAKSEAQK